MLLKLAGGPPDWRFEGVAQELGLSKSAVHRSLARAADARLYDPAARLVNSAALLEFLVHGLRYAFPARMEGEARGIPTAWAAKPLSDVLVTGESLPPVWPHELGETRGIAVAPLHDSAPNAARRDPELAVRLALVDGLRLGDARVRESASEELSHRLADRQVAPS